MQLETEMPSVIGAKMLQPESGLRPQQGRSEIRVSDFDSPMVTFPVWWLGCSSLSFSSIDVKSVEAGQGG